jgi:hypothetical protein
MNFTELFNMSSLAAASGVEYGRLRNNLLARPEKVKLTPDEREAVIKAATHGLNELTTFLR